ncbi:hypothetical protein V8E54_003500 [Elaphomyces granulatus]
MIKNKEKAEVMILELMMKYSFNLSHLKHLLGKHNLDVSFPKVRYSDIAPLVGLNPNARGRDIPTFEMFYARLPNEIFPLIVSDIRMFAAQYGPMIDHANEEARSRYLSSYFNRIVALFSGHLLNTPETILEGRLTTKGRIEYQFQTYGAINVVFIEVKLEIGGQSERLNFVAQVIAECDACAWMNKQMGCDVPIMAILCDGSNFFFYRYIDNCENSRQLFLGEFPGGGMRLHIEDMSVGASIDPLSFYRNLRRVCDALYYVFLSGYQSGVEAYWKRSVEMGKTEGKGRKSTLGWHKVTALASKALEEAKSAWNLHNEGKVKESEESGKRAAKFLAERYVLRRPSLVAANANNKFLFIVSMKLL